MPKIITRKAAKARGLTRYFTGVPCPKGHVCERHVINAACDECVRVRKRARPSQAKAPRLCVVCKKLPVHYRAAKTCLECRDEYRTQMRRTADTARYWKDPVKARAEKNAIKKATKAKDPEKWNAKKRARYRAAVAKDPEKMQVQAHASYLRQKAKDPEKLLAQANARYAKNADRINAQARDRYWKDPVTARAKNRAKQKSRKERHPKRFRALRRAADARKRAKGAW
jgi:hypothetical protein